MQHIVRSEWRCRTPLRFGTSTLTIGMWPIAAPRNKSASVNKCRTSTKPQSNSAEVRNIDNGDQVIGAAARLNTKPYSQIGKEAEPTCSSDVCPIEHQLTA